jgi:predicted Zn-dependent protease
MWHDDQTFWLHVLSHYPDYLPAMWKIVWVATLRQDYSVALPVVEEIRRRRPGDLELQSLAGFLYLKTGRYPAAVATLEPLARTNLWMPAARYNLAGAYARLGSNVAAVAVLKELVARQPEYADYAQRDREFFSIRELPEFVETVRGRPPS